MITDEALILKYKTLGWSDEAIARKTGRTVEAVAASWKHIQQDYAASQSNGYQEFCKMFTVMANQYQLLGESLRIVAEALSNTMSAAELEKLIVKDNPEKTLENLRNSCMILRPFVPIPPEESLKRHVSEN